MKRIAIALLFTVVALAAAAQQFDLSIDNIMRGPGLYGWTPEDVRWSPDGQRVYFSWKLYSDTLEHDRDTYVVNRDGSGLRKLSDDEKKDAPPVNAQWTRDKHRAVYLDDADVYLWDSAAGKRRALTQTNDVESAPQFTFDETRVTFVRANNVFAIDLANGSIAQLTNIVAPDDKGPNVTLWDDAAKKGTASQEYIKAEERKLLDIVDRKAKKREEDEAKRKRRERASVAQWQDHRPGHQQRVGESEENDRSELHHRGRVHGDDSEQGEGWRCPAAVADCCREHRQWRCEVVRAWFEASAGGCDAAEER
jgi:dipeptidyl aminopeptidase/acylaminoacyl peptidase